jgi:hypothetical protein
LAGSADESGFADGVGKSARFGLIGGIVTDASGNIFVADTTNHRIRKVTSSGVVSTFAGSTRGSKEGTGTTAQFSFPERIAIDKSGNLYVSEITGYTNEAPTFRIRKVSATGVTSTIKTGTGSIKSMAVYGTTLQQNLAYSLAEDYTPRVWRVATSGGTASLLTREGEEVYSRQIASNAAGHLLVSNENNFRVSRLSGTNWTDLELNVPYQGEPQIKSLASNATGDDLFVPTSLEPDVAEGLFRFSVSSNSSFQVLENRNPYMADVSERQREGNSLNSISNGGFIESIAVSPAASVYFTELANNYYYSEKPIWATSSFWNAISKNLIKDLSDLTGDGPIPGTEDTDPVWWGPWELPQNSAIRHLIPLDYTVNYPGTLSIATGQSVEELVVETNSAANLKFQWYRSGVKIASATTNTYRPTTSGVYNLEIIHGTGNDSVSVVTPPCVITITDAATAQSRSLLQSVDQSNWYSVMAQVAANTKATAAKGGDAAFLNGVAGVTLALRDLETSGLLAKLGFTGSPNPLSWTVVHSGELPEGVLSAETRAFLISKVYPRLLEADTQLGRITDKNFVTPFPSSNLFDAEGVHADYGDVQLMRAFLKGGMWLIKWMEGMNTDFAVDDLRNAFEGGKLSVEWILSKYPLLLGAGTASATTASIGHLKSALDSYFAWSDFVKGPTATAQGRMQSLGSEATSPFLFSLAPEDLADESRVRAELKNTRTALDGKTTQSVPLVFKESDEEPLFGLLGAQSGTTYSLKVNTLALLSRPTGWRTEVASLGFTKNLTKLGNLTSTSNTANKTLKSILPDLSAADFLKIETGLIDSETLLNEKWHTRWDTEPPTVAMNIIGTGGKAIPAEDGTVAVSGTIRDASVVTSISVKRTSEDGREEVVDGTLSEQQGSVDRNRLYTWQAWVPLSAGKNVIAASAVDIWGQVTDKPATQTVQAEIQYAFTIDQEGEGLVTSSVAGSTVAGGTTIDIKVTPSKNWIFRHFEIYMDGQELDRVTATALKLKVTGETRIVPVFEPDPFRFMTGPVTLSRRVFVYGTEFPFSVLTVTANKTGSVSGKLRIGRQLYPFTTTFGADNTAEINFRPQLRQTYPMESVRIQLALVIKSNKTDLVFSDNDSQPDMLKTLGELKSVTITSNMVFNGSVKEMEGSATTDFIHLRLSNLGIASCAGILGNGERYTASTPVSLGSGSTEYRDYEEGNIAPGAETKIRATLQPITTNKYTVMATEVIFHPPSTELGPNEPALWNAQVSCAGERWASNNRWPVDSSGKQYAPDPATAQPGEISISDWRFLNSDSSIIRSLLQFLPATVDSFGAFSTESSFASANASPFTANDDGASSSYRVGYLKWTAGTVLVDSATIASKSEEYPELNTGQSASRPRMTFTVNRSTGLFYAKAGWMQSNDGMGPATIIAPKTFTGVLITPNMNGPIEWGIGKSTDGTSLFISGDTP